MEGISVFKVWQATSLLKKMNMKAPFLVLVIFVSEAVSYTWSTSINSMFNTRNAFRNDVSISYIFYKNTYTLYVLDFNICSTKLISATITSDHFKAVT